MDQQAVRVRCNAKQTSKGEWQFDCTVETDNPIESRQLLLQTVIGMKSDFKSAELKIAGEE